MYIRAVCTIVLLSEWMNAIIWQHNSMWFSVWCHIVPLAVKHWKDASFQQPLPRCNFSVCFPFCVLSVMFIPFKLQWKRKTERIGKPISHKFYRRLWHHKYYTRHVWAPFVCILCFQEDVKVLFIYPAIIRVFHFVVGFIYSCY